MKQKESDKLDTLVRNVSRKFRTFGGGKTSDWNPLTNALSDKPVCFAAGVDVREVVEYTISEMLRLCADD